MKKRLQSLQLELEHLYVDLIPALSAVKVKDFGVEEENTLEMFQAQIYVPSLTFCLWTEDDVLQDRERQVLSQLDRVLSTLKVVKKFQTHLDILTDLLDRAMVICMRMLLHFKQSKAEIYGAVDNLSFQHIPLAHPNNRAKVLQRSGHELLVDFYNRNDVNAETAGEQDEY
jgi:hypothetical protein